MQRYHINTKGEPGLCSAASGKCPFGADAPHYDSVIEARQAYEKSQSKSLVSTKKEPKAYVLARNELLNDWQDQDFRSAKDLPSLLRNIATSWATTEYIGKESPEGRLSSGSLFHYSPQVTGKNHPKIAVSLKYDSLSNRLYEVTQIGRGWGNNPLGKAGRVNIYRVVDLGNDLPGAIAHIQKTSDQTFEHYFSETELGKDNTYSPYARRNTSSAALTGNNGLLVKNEINAFESRQQQIQDRLGSTLLRLEEERTKQQDKKNKQHELLQKSGFVKSP
jgi:hypothetical protein